MSGTWVSDDNVALLTDLYELNMLQAYFDSRMNDTAVFDLFVRRLPRERDYLVAAGLDDVLDYLGTLHFSEESLSYLRSLGAFSEPFLAHLRGFRFTGDVYAVPEGTAVFANEPILEIVAPLPEAQVVESSVMNQIHMQTLAASKAARVVAAAAGRTVVDFGLRRIHGADAALKMARAFYIAGIHATSNLLAGRIYGIPVAGTMAHSFVEAHASEIDAFASFTNTFPSTILLVDTYDTREGVRHVAELKQRLGDAFRVTGIRIDSGNLDRLSRECRALLDKAGLHTVQIFVSSSLDEYEIERLLAGRAPIDGFGVGTRMGVSSDAPFLDAVYKLVEYGGRPRMKLSEEKRTLPGRKQVFRQADKDVVGLRHEAVEGDPLLLKVMANGRRLDSGRKTIEDARQTFQADRHRLNLPAPERPVATSEGLAALVGLYSAAPR